ncbi:unnamed protein product [Linum tenue]|uniref:Uncharacterized protein n=1 Tax=Linum tenue TaxID=586396 RepID=A0AAV0NAA8_9ROSI|nr:unnamed protein product [Linum tenue]
MAKGISHNGRGVRFVHGFWIIFSRIWSTTLTHLFLFPTAKKKKSEEEEVGRTARNLMMMVWMLGNSRASVSSYPVVAATKSLGSFYSLIVVSKERKRLKKPITCCNPNKSSLLIVI